jgi:hypothetical protein
MSLSQKCPLTGKNSPPILSPIESNLLSNLVVSVSYRKGRWE